MAELVHGRSGGRTAKGLIGTRGAVRAYLKAVYRDPCVYCGDRTTCFDHIVSQYRGGSDDWTNLAPVCSSCNSSKRTSSLLGFLMWRLTTPERLEVEHTLSTMRAWRKVGA